MKSLRVILLILLPGLFGLKAGAQDNKPVNEDGLYGGLSFGTWFPDNVNKVLSSPLLLGPTLLVKNGKNSWGLTFDMIGWPQHTTKKPINVKVGDTVLSRDEFYGAHITLDYYRQLAATGRFIFEGTGGLGYGDMSYYNPNKDTNIGKACLIFNPGISLRYLVNRRTYWQLKIQYCFANYRCMTISALTSKEIILL